jgi:ABC-type dipeptide/oligopeptide/nickel transport system permease subunit
MSIRDSTQWRIFKTNRLALVCIGFLIFIYALSFIGSLFLEDPFDVYDPRGRYQPPSAEHLFGTDKQGRDVFSLTVYGGRLTLTVGFIATLISLVIGLVYGSIMGYKGGRTDYWMMQGVMMVASLPPIVLIVIIMGIFGRNIHLVMVLI